MKFLIDADCPRSIGSSLKTANYEVKDIWDIKPAASDDEIYALIKREGFILITRDTDFSNILRYPATAHCGIILLRVYLLGTEEVISLLKSLLIRVTEKELLGSITVVTRDRYRIHKV